VRHRRLVRRISELEERVEGLEFALSELMKAERRRHGQNGRGLSPHSAGLLRKAEERS